MRKLLEKLTQTFGPSGNETKISNIIEEEIKEFADAIQKDALGNLIAVKKGRGKKKIMIAAHMDEIGVIVTHIDENGFLRFSNIGWVSQYFSLGQRVVFENGTTGSVFYEEKLDEMKDLKFGRMYIDIGAVSREDALSKVKIGDMGVFSGNIVFQDDKAISKALDDRAGCAIAIKTLKHLKDSENDVYFVFTTQEEVGLRGAKASAYNVRPDICIALDVTDVGDTPECHKMEVSCGKGPAIKVKDNMVICHPMVKNLLVDSAKRQNIPHQFEILTAGGTDIGAIHLEVGGIPSGAVSIPCRYIHSPSEMVSMTDLENCVKLLLEALK